MMWAGERANLSCVSCSAVPRCLTLHRPGLGCSGRGAAQQILAMGPKGGLGHRTRLIQKGGFCQQHELCGLVRAGAVPPALPLSLDLTGGDGVSCGL